jgi:hypothetical protein
LIGGSSEDYDGLYRSAAVTFHRGLTKKILKLVPQQPDIAVVGLVASFSIPPAAISINHRNVSSFEPAHAMLPLMPSEVAPGGVVEIQLLSGGWKDTVLDSVIVFVLPSGEIPLDQRGWMDRESLLDFEDNAIVCTSELGQTLMRVVRAVNFGTIGMDESIEPSLIEGVVRVMYSNPEWTLYARGVLVRCGRVKEGVIAIWGRKLRDMIAAGQIDPQLWNYVWRDFSRFPDEVKRGIQEVIWAEPPATWSVEAALSAFSSEDLP